METLRDVICEQHESWTAEQLKKLLNFSAPEAALLNITEVPSTTWSAIVAAGLMRPSSANVHAYVKAHGVDKDLAGYLIEKEGEPSERCTSHRNWTRVRNPCSV